MRDPDARIEILPDVVRRRLRSGMDGNSLFIRTDTANQLVESGKVLPYWFEDSSTILSARLAFVSYPFEWSDAQLYCAAELTLDISEGILASGYELKDASAWNVIFRGDRAAFCDLLSFQRIAGPRWWAFGQFVRNFIFPLAISKHCGLAVSKSYSSYRDGPPASLVRRQLGLRRFLTRYWPLFFESSKSARVDAAPRLARGAHADLYEFCRFLLRGVRPAAIGSEWANYTASRAHYSSQALEFKASVIRNWISKISPKRVVDFGCNTGEYSIFSAEAGASVISIDLDPQSIQKLFLSGRCGDRILPVVTDLADAVGGRGWRGTEFPSIFDRLRQAADLVLMLALLHHLAITEGIGFDQISDLAADTTRGWLIVEVLAPSDPMVISLCALRNRSPSDFSLERQMAALGRNFEVIESLEIPSTVRKLCLLRRGS